MMNQTDWTYKFSRYRGSTRWCSERSSRIEVIQRPFYRHLLNGAATSTPVPASSSASLGRRFPIHGLATDARNKSDLGIAAVYVQDQIEVTRWLQIIGGVRFDRFDLGYVNLNGQRTASARLSAVSTIWCRRASAWCQAGRTGVGLR